MPSQDEKPHIYGDSIAQMTQYYSDGLTQALIVAIQIGLILALAVSVWRFSLRNPQTSDVSIITSTVPDPIKLV
jgi:hypothetical protein